MLKSDIRSGLGGVMKSKRKSKREFVFTSPFALKDSTSRLRRLAQKHHWKIDLEPTEVGDYTFHTSLRRWLPLSVSGILQRDGDSTLVMGKVDINWTLLLIMAITILGLVVYQASSALQPLDMLRLINKYWDLSAAGTWVNIAFNILLIVAQVAIALAVFIGVRRVFTQHKHMAKMLQQTLVDAIPDLPQTNMMSTEDGELLPLDDMPRVLEESAKQKR
jgi:hypothetical protein